MVDRPQRVESHNPGGSNHHPRSRYRWTGVDPNTDSNSGHRLNAMPSWRPAVGAGSGPCRSCAPGFAERVGVLGSPCWSFLFASGHAARVSTSNRKGASTPGKVGPGQVDTGGVVPISPSRERARWEGKQPEMMRTENGL
jgi:hypothetical protein